jgi:hypothetical protein
MRLEKFELSEKKVEKTILKISGESLCQMCRFDPVFMGYDYRYHRRVGTRQENVKSKFQSLKDYLNN